MARKVVSPHDKFIKGMMAQKEVMGGFFKQHLPSFIQEQVDFESIKPQKDSFVSDRLRVNLADILFEAKINGKVGYFYTLLEHQSTPDKMMPFRLLKYIVAIQEHHMKKHKTQVLPFVYPIVLYTGKTPYSYSMDLFNLFGDHKDLAKKVGSKPYDLVDLSQHSDEEIERFERHYGMMCLLAKHVHDEDIMAFLPRLVSHFLKKIDGEGGESYTELAISYLIEAVEIPDKERFIKIVQEIESVDEVKVMTLAEQWKQEGLKKGLEKGRLEGMEKGMEKGRAEVALNLLAQGFDESRILSVTGISKEEFLKIKRTVH